jgi:hypothetical protein
MRTLAEPVKSLWAAEAPLHFDITRSPSTPPSWTKWKSDFSKTYARKLTISVRPDGKIHVTMTTRYTSPAKNYVLDALEATNDQLEGTVLDFRDINTPPEKGVA